MSDPSGHNPDNFAAEQHAGLDGIRLQIGPDGIQLGGDGFGFQRVDRLNAKRILRSHSR
ncbi:hypothetical protein D3C74_461810 [compost metagenome]